MEAYYTCSYIAALHSGRVFWLDKYTQYTHWTKNPDFAHCALHWCDILFHKSLVNVKVHWCQNWRNLDDKQHAAVYFGQNFIKLQHQNKLGKVFHVLYYINHIHFPCELTFLIQLMTFSSKHKVQNFIKLCGVWCPWNNIILDSFGWLFI